MVGRQIARAEIRPLTEAVHDVVARCRIGGLSLRKALRPAALPWSDSIGPGTPLDGVVRSCDNQIERARVACAAPPKKEKQSLGSAFRNFLFVDSAYRNARGDDVPPKTRATGLLNA